MDWLAIVSLIVRALAFVLWLYVVWLIVKHDRPIPRAVRLFTCSIIVFGLAIFVIGGLTPLGFPVELARSVSTVFAAFAAIIALGIITTDILDDRPDSPHD